MRNFDSNGMEQGDVEAIKAEIAALEAERLALLSSPQFRAASDI